MEDIDSNRPLSPREETPVRLFERENDVLSLSREPQTEVSNDPILEVESAPVMPELEYQHVDGSQRQQQQQQQPMVPSYAPPLVSPC